MRYYGSNSPYGICVGSNGEISLDGWLVYSSSNGIRPAMWIDLGN
jgi:hypothetical protein